MKTVSARQGKFRAFSCDVGSVLRDELVKQNIPVASSCGGDGICGKCVVSILTSKGAPPSELERATLQRNGKDFNDGFRLSCQMKILEDIEVDASYW